MKWIIRIYSLVLLAYTGWRTYDFISSTLPKNDISFWLSIAFLFATEAGLVLWHEAHLKHTTTDTQDKLTFALTWIDFVGSLAAGIADMILRQTFIEGYQIPPMLAQFLLYGLPCIMAINVAGVILFEQNDAETQEDKAEKAARFKIHQEAMKQIRADRQTMATEKSHVIYDRIRGRVTGHVDTEYGGGTTQASSPPKKKRFSIYPPVTRTKHAYNAETPATSKVTGASGGGAETTHPDSSLADAEYESSGNNRANFTRRRPG
jgi:hypothetical protein